jgi:hypothetical protein
VLKWLGLGGLLLGIAAFGGFGLLGLLFYEPPIEAPWLLSPGSRPGEVIARGFAGGDCWFEVTGLGPDAACTLVARRADGRQVLREESRHAARSGCRGRATPLPGDTWTLTFTAEGASTTAPSVKAYQSHGDGFPHLTGILVACALVGASGLGALVLGVRRDRRERRRG